MTKDEIFELCDNHIEQITTGIISLSELVWNQAWNEAIDAAINYISETRERDVSLEDMEKLKR